MGDLPRVGHEPDKFAALYRQWLTEDGFDVRAETTTRAFADPEIANLCAAVRGGVGLAGHHGGMCDAFRDAVEYQFMCGGQWVAHPGGIIDYRVDVTRPDDPVMHGISGFAYRSARV